MTILGTAGTGGDWDGGRGLGGFDPNHRWPRRLSRYAFRAFASLSIALLAGFGVFLASIDRSDIDNVRRADAIVVLTGGAERISDAVEWLRSGKGDRLLVSGVSADMTPARLAQTSPALRSVVDCCVDLGKAARNTVGNAKEARFWALANGYRSLVVVTSSYHMPRAMVELRRHLPGIELIRAPVVTTKLRDMDFLANPGLFKTIAAEYAKFLVAYARASLTPARPMEESSLSHTKRRA
jgi:uncharacterized SAM-binding protein YcdF (DUF218 family)